MITTEHLSYVYPDGRPALRDVSLRVAAGERVVLLGANGCGKSTLLKILNGLLFPDQGHYRYGGTAITARSLKQRDWQRRFRREVVLLFQHPDAMLFNPTVFDEIAYGLRQLHVAEAHLEGRVMATAARFGLEEVLPEPPFRLSGGEKQKVCLAALLVLEPKLLLLDEPTANLDPRSTGHLIDLLQETPVTTITATHNLSLAAELGTRAVVMDEDHALAYDGDLAGLLQDRDALLSANLLHRHRHQHGTVTHRHYHLHDWD